MRQTLENVILMVLYVDTVWNDCDNIRNKCLIYEEPFSVLQKNIFCRNVHQIPHWPHFGDVSKWVLSKQVFHFMLKGNVLKFLYTGVTHVTDPLHKQWRSNSLIKRPFVEISSWMKVYPKWNVMSQKWNIILYYKINSQT